MPYIKSPWVDTLKELLKHRIRRYSITGTSRQYPRLWTLQPMGYLRLTHQMTTPGQSHPIRLKTWKTLLLPLLRTTNVHMGNRPKRFKGHIKGKIQYVKSSTCTLFRGALAGVLQTIWYIETTQKKSTGGHIAAIIICCKDPKLMSQLRKQKHKYNDGSTNKGLGQELLQEIPTITNRFERYNFHHSMKLVLRESTNPSINQACIDCIQQTHHDTLANLKTWGSFETYSRISRPTPIHAH
jgi:hypothetical protein